MPRLACLGDLHIGAGADFGLTPTGPGSRLADQETLWKGLAADVFQAEVDGVLFAGDGFHRRQPSPAEILALRRGLNVFRNEGLEVVAIDGNHDVITAALPSALETVQASASWDVSRRPQLRRVAGVTVATLPWTPLAQLVAARGGGDRADLYREAADLLLETARGLRVQAEALDGPAILLAHWAVSGASTPNGIPTELFREPVLDTDELARIGFSAVVLGHVHKPQIVDASAASVFYVGSPWAVDWSEAGSEHGFWILDTDPDVDDLEFRPVRDRPFVSLAFEGEDVELLDGPGFIGSRALDGAIVRLRYTATEEQARRLDHAKIRQALLDAGARKVYAIQPTILRPERARVADVDETLGPLEAFDLWAASQEITPALRGELHDRTKAYLEEVRG